MKFSYRLQIGLRILLIVIALGFMATTAFYVYQLVDNVMLATSAADNVGAFVSGSIIGSIITIILCVALTIFAIFMLNTHYKATENKLSLKIGFIDVLGGKVKIENILNVVKKPDEHKLYLSYLGGNLDPIIMQINIEESKFDDFAQELKKMNDKIVLSGFEK